MSDAPTPGDRLDTLIQEAREALADLRDSLDAKAEEVSVEVNAAVDALSAKIDELQAAWAARSSE